MKSNVKLMLVLMALPLAMTGCTTAITTRVSGNGAGLAPPARLAIAPADEDAPLVDGETQSILGAALSKRGYMVSDEGDYILDFSLADRPAAMGASIGQSGPSLSAVKTKKPLQSCKDRTHRLTILIADRKSGQTVYQGGAEEHHCKGSLADSRAAMVNALVADIRQPGGVRLLSRKGKE